MTARNHKRTSKVIVLVASLVLVLGLLPFSAFAEDGQSGDGQDSGSQQGQSAPEPGGTRGGDIQPQVNPSLWVGDTPVIGDQTGTDWSYDANNKTLTLDGATITGTHSYDGTNAANIYANNMDLTLVLKGTNSVSGGTTAIYVDSGTLTINKDTDGSSLTAEGTVQALYGENNIHIGEGLKIVEPAGGEIKDNTVKKDDVVAKKVIIGEKATVDASTNPSGGGTVTGGGDYAKGTTATVTAQANQGYRFVNWTKGDTVIADNPYSFTVTDDVTLRANFEQVFTITFKNDDGTILQSSQVAKGALPEYAGTTPTKAATAQYTYTFTGWSPAIVEATADATYTATYSQAVRKYKVTFVNDDGTVLKEATEYDYGTAAANIAKPANPTKAEDEQSVYEFASWSPAIADVTADATYKATYTAKDKYTCTDGAGGTYTKGSGKTLSLTFTRAVDDEVTSDRLTGIEVDGKTVDEKNDSGKVNYKVKKGSAIIELQSVYLDTLAAGNHTLKANFSDGSATADFTVADKGSSSSSKGSSAAKTGDTFPVSAVVALAIAAAAALGVALFAVYRRKRSKQ